VPLEIQPNLKRLGVILLFWPIHFCSLALELALTLLRHPTCFQPSSETRSSSLFFFLIAITWVKLKQVSRVRMHQKSKNVIYNDIIERFRRFHSVWGQKLRFLRILKSTQRRNFSSPAHYQKYYYRMHLSEVVLREPHLKHYQQWFISSYPFQLLGTGLSEAVLHVEPLLIILWIMSSGSCSEPLSICELSAAVQNMNYYR
jgi:hypothetical protein